MKAVWLLFFIGLNNLQGEYLLVKLDEKGNKNLDFLFCGLRMT
jgi:hypothetical protein